MQLIPPVLTLPQSALTLDQPGPQDRKSKIWLNKATVTFFKLCHTIPLSILRAVAGVKSKANLHWFFINQGAWTGEGGQVAGSWHRSA